MAFERHRINRRVIDDLKVRSTMGMYFYIVITLVVLIVNGFYERHPVFSAVFMTTMIGVAVFRILHFHLFDRIGSMVGWKVNYGIFFASVHATSLIWGLGFAYCIVLPGEETTKMLMLTSTAGLNAGGVVAFIPARFLSIAYNLTMLLPAIAAMSWFRIHFTLVFLFLLFAVYMTIMALRGNREYWDALENEYQLRVKTEEIQKMSRVDNLTGLYNRDYFDEMFALQFKMAARSESPLSLVICDIDHFKPINDTYGHLAGDAYLVKIAEILAAAFQRETDFLARYGGEEFVVLLPGQKSGDALDLCENVRAAVEGLVFRHHSHRIQTTMSFGIATCVPRMDDERDRLLERADTALYRAKNGGRNRIVVYEEENGRMHQANISDGL